MSKNQRHISVVVAVVLMLFAAVMVAVQQSRGRGAAVPAGYRLPAEVDLSGGPFDGAELGSFVVGEAAVTHFHLSLQNIDTPALILSLQAEGGSRYTILRAENYRTDGDGGGRWQESLPAGRYRLQLAAPQSAGVVAVYLQDTN